MAKIPFNVSARTARLIGRENVSNADGAIIELVKNGYDADAKRVDVAFVDDDLYIIDCGHGMTEEVIRTSWMTIGTNNKEVDPFSPNKRVRAGAKGIGRFALDRLGTRVEMFTLPKDEKDGYIWSVNWDDFEKEATVVSSVKANLGSVKKLQLTQMLPVSFLESRSEMGKLLSRGGTILKISGLRDVWDEGALQSLFQNLESLVPGVEENRFSISLFSSSFQNKFGLVQPLITEDFDYRLFARFNSKTKRVSITIERAEFDVLDLKKRFGEVFNSPLMKEFPYDFETFQKKEFTRDFEVSDLIKGFKDPRNLLENVGDFSFILTFAKNALPNKKDLLKYPYRNAEYSARSEWLKKFGGIKIFRDNFRVRPYGENGEDWLRLGERQAKSPAGAGQGLGGFKVRPNQVVGAINISRIHNGAFQDKSGREGILENDAFKMFKNLVLGIIGVLEEDRNTVFFALSELYKEKDEREVIKTAGLDARERIKDKIKQNKGNGTIFENETLVDAGKVVETLEVLEEEIENKNEEIQILRSLASSGLITAAVAHELRGLENVLTTRNKELRDLIAPYIQEKDVKDLKEAFNPFVLLSEMEQTDKNLQEWLSYALMPLKRDKRKRTTIFLNEYFEHLHNTWHNLLAERKISFVADSIDRSFRVKACPIDMDTVFNNLVINSVESFTRQKNRSRREITVTCSLEGEKYKIIYSDTGAGLDDSYKKNPMKIFEPQETTKRDSEGNVIGTGMGMYLVKSAVEENGGSVDIIQNSNGFSLGIHFSIK